MSEELAKLFHETYAKLAPSFNKVPGLSWGQLPERERVFRIAVADIIELNFFGGAANQPEDEFPSEFFTSSGYGANTREPFVELIYNGRKLAQMPPEDATRLAHSLLEAAEAAFGDAFLIEFMRDRVGVEMAQIGGLLVEFREFRDRREESNRESE